MPQSKIDTSNPSAAADTTEPAAPSITHEGEPTTPAPAGSPRSRGLDAPAPRRDAPPAWRGPKQARARDRGSAKAHGTARRFNSRHRG